MQLKKQFVSFLFCSTVVIVAAQDIHFSQFNETPQLLNPGATGVYNGYMRAIVNYKNQWSAMGNAFNTTTASFDMPIFDHNEHKAHLGAGINFFSDKAGDSRFGLTEINLCFAGIIPLNYKSKLSMGLSVGGAQHTANLNALSWGNQYDGQGFNPAVSSYENTPVNSFMYADIGAGVYYEYNNGKATVERNEQKKITAGIAYFHINRPVQKYFSVTEKLYGKLVMDVSGDFDITGTRFSILSSAIFFRQGSSNEITAGGLVRYRIKNGTKVTGFYNESGIALGMYYRFKDAIIPQLYYQLQSFSVGVSYDLNLSSYKIVSHAQGGIEVSLKYHILKGALFKQKKMI